MKQLTCEMCGSNDLLKQDGVFVCQTCGTKYSVEEAKKMMVEGTVEVSGTVKVDQSHLIENFLDMASSAIASGNNSEAEQYCNKVIEIDPNNYKAFLYKGTATAWQSTFANIRIQETINCWKKALSNCGEESSTEIRSYTDAEFSKIVIAMVQLAGSLVEDGVNQYNGDSYQKHLTSILKCIKSYVKSINSTFQWEELCSEAAISVVPCLIKCAKYHERLYHKIKPSAGDSYKDLITEYLFCIDLFNVTATFGQEDAAKALCYEKAAEVWQTINTLPYYFRVNGYYQTRTNNDNHFGSHVAEYKQKAAEANARIAKKEKEKNREEFWSKNSDAYKSLTDELKKSKTERNKLNKAKTGYSKIALLDEHISKIEEILEKDRAKSSQILKSEINFIKNFAAFWVALSSDNDYDAFLDKYPILKKANEYTNKRSELIARKKEIDERKNEYKKGILLWALCALSIVFAVVGVVIPAVVDEDLLFLGVAMGVIGVLAALGTGVNASSNSEFTSAQGVEKTKALERKYQSEVISYNKTIDKMNAVPEYKGKIGSAKKVVIPEKIVSTLVPTSGVTQIADEQQSQEDIQVNEVPAVTEEVSNSLEDAEFISPLKNADKEHEEKIGTTIKFGRYNDGNGISDIEWDIVNVVDGNALLLSKNVLDCKPYHSSSEDVTWETCTIRKWLNNEFFTDAFSDAEKMLVKSVLVLAEKNPSYANTDPGIATQDKVFLLSVNEATTLFTSDEERLSCSTDYAAQKGVYVEDEGFAQWWLRNSGETQNVATVVTNEGFVYDCGVNVEYDDVGVRPAIWIKL